MEKIFGYEVGELDGQSSRILYLDQFTYEAFGINAYPIIKAHDIYRTQLEMRKKNGQRIWIDISGVQLPGSKNDTLWKMLDISELKKHQQEVELLAYHDFLTGLPNRLLIVDRLGQALAQAKRTGEFVAVCYIDLDNFKPVNDHHGHASGDKLLLEIVRRMKLEVRAHDTLGRIGGDEFVLILMDIKKVDEYAFILQRIINTINIPVLLDNATQVSVGASIGVTVFPNDNNETDLLLRHADEAMYQAKKMGRNRFCLFDIQAI